MLARAVHYLVVLAFFWFGLSPVGARAHVLAGTFARGFEHVRSTCATGTLWAVGGNNHG